VVKEEAALRLVQPDPAATPPGVVSATLEAPEVVIQGGPLAERPSKVTIDDRAILLSNGESELALCAEVSPPPPTTQAQGGSTPAPQGPTMPESVRLKSGAAEIRIFKDGLISCFSAGGVNLSQGDDSFVSIDDQGNVNIKGTKINLSGEVTIGPKLKDQSGTEISGPPTTVMNDLNQAKADITKLEQALEAFKTSIEERTKSAQKTTGGSIESRKEALRRSGLDI
jgi:hypothetical protein